MPLDSEGQLYMNSIYKREKLKKLSDFTVIPEGATSSFEGLSLVDYITTRQDDMHC